MVSVLPFGPCPPRFTLADNVMTHVALLEVLPPDTKLHSCCFLGSLLSNSFKRCPGQTSEGPQSNCICLKRRGKREGKEEKGLGEGGTREGGEGTREGGEETRKGGY